MRYAAAALLFATGCASGVGTGRGREPASTAEASQGALSGAGAAARGAPGLDLAETGRIRQASNVVLSPAGDRVAFVLGDSLLIAPTASGTDARTPPPGSAAMVVATGVRDEASAPVPFLAWAPDGQRLLYRGGGVGDGVPMLASLDGRPPRPLLADSVGRRLATFQNFLAGGPAWAPDGVRIAFLAMRRTDTTGTLQVYVADVASGRVERWTPEGRARFSVAWSPDGRWLAYTSGGFGPGAPAGTVELLDARPGAPRTPVLLAQDSTPLLREVRWSPDGRLVLAQNRPLQVVAVRLVDDDAAGRGTPRAVAVSHALPRRAFAGWLSDGDGLALLTAVRAGMSTRLAMVAFPSGRLTVLSGPDTLTTPIGAALPSASPSASASTPLAVLVSRPTSSRAVVAFQREGGALPSDVWVAELDAGAVGGAPRLLNARNVTRANPWLDPARLPHVRIVRWVSGDTVRRDTLDAQLLVPRGERPARGWPLVVVPYGGYRNEFPRSEYFLDRGLLALVGHGYAIVRPNTRGRSDDDRDWGQYGRPQLEDTERLLEALAGDGTVDPRRVAVIGHSHGGAMAYYYLTHATPWRAPALAGVPRFCAAVAVNGRADWVLQGSMADGDGVLPDQLGGTPAEQPARYRAFSPAANARAALAPLLAVAGGKDTQILPANVPIMADSMRAAGRQVETLVFPDEGHLLLAEANVRRFWERAFATISEGCGKR